MRLFLMLLVALAGLAQRSRDLEVVPVERRMALVIGNSNYSLGKLKNPVNDALAMERTLRKLGFEVTSVKDANFRQMRTALNAFAAGLRKGDLAFFYYAGHGLQIKERNYLVPVDFTGESMTDAEYETLAADQVRQRLEESAASVRLLVLDACRNNPFPAASRSGVTGLREMERAEGTLVAFATGANNVADDNVTEANGLYTKYLIEALETPGLNHVDVFKRVQAEVKRTSPGGKQNPAYYDNIIGLVVLNAAGGTVNISTAGPGAPRNEINEEEAYWKECQAQKGAYCEAYLNRFPTGRFVELARLNREKRSPEAGQSDLGKDKEGARKGGVPSTIIWDSASASKGRELSKELVAAAGGKDRIEAVKDYSQRVNYKAILNGDKISLKKNFSWIHPQVFREVAEFGFGMKMITFFDGESGFEKNGKSETRLAGASASMVRRQIKLDYLVILQSINAAPDTVSFVQEGELDIKSKPGSSFRLHYDRMTKLPTKVVYFDESYTDEVSFQNYKEFGGVKFPMLLQKSRNFPDQGMNLSETFELMELKLNTGLTIEGLSAKK